MQMCNCESVHVLRETEIQRDRARREREREKQ
jgi:hypothetical protein